MTASPVTPGPRPQLRRSWAQIQREKQQRWFYRLLDRSFGFRLLVAVGSAILLLGAVNRWEQCRDHGVSAACVLRDAGGIISVSNMESLSIVTAAFLYVLEGSKRRQRENQEALEVILTFQQAGAKLSYARNSALERLSEGGLWLDGLDLSRTHLDDLQAAGGRWREVNLSRASLRHACFEDADLRGADLSEADLSHANLRHADLRGASLRGADLSEADLRGAALTGASTEGARLSGTRLEGAALGDHALG
ncbi:pentapeptide repeat-containing protein [Cyanobium sp. ATX 6F1]|uniref:pentapeptide repeat-containing protein n=1 Tax=unclassified Cyanobium TaxID=2627006 RepID=UPI0020CED6CD|nr:pentapeptide repeat-containing protein [Cyanobium sp. ATX 6F1]MCP9917687.1 pentapeptide repeat-containing protein [Cyanobium sp. ATX 6F1]